MNCTIHANESIQLVCLEDKCNLDMICINCLSNQHKKHRIIHIDEYIKEQTNEAKIMLQNFSQLPKRNYEKTFLKQEKIFKGIKSQIEDIYSTLMMKINRELRSQMLSKIGEIDVHIQAMKEVYDPKKEGQVLFRMYSLISATGKKILENYLNHTYQPLSDLFMKIRELKENLNMKISTPNEDLDKKLKSIYSIKFENQLKEMKIQVNYKRISEFITESEQKFEYFKYFRSIKLFEPNFLKEFSSIKSKIQQFSQKDAAILENPIFLKNKINIIAIGDHFSGKTSILHRYSKGEKVEFAPTTIGVDYEFKNIQIEEKEIKLKIWDTAGQERFRSFTRRYYKHMQGVLLIFDITNKWSFLLINNWMNELINYGDLFSTKYLVGNKTDKENHREISENEATYIAQQYNMKYYECSAVTGQGIDIIFHDISLDIYRNKRYIFSNNLDFPNTKIVTSKKKKKEQNSGCAVFQLIV